MSIPLDRLPAIHVGNELRSVHPDSIIEAIHRGLDRVSVQFADNQLITVPYGWHGEGKTGEVLVKVGSMLTEPIAGTKLLPLDFVRWTNEQDFTVATSSGRSLDVIEAESLLKSDKHADMERPLLRFTRNGNGRTPVEIQIYNGGTCAPLQTLSQIGNTDFQYITPADRTEYVKAVRQLFPFISKGTKDARVRLGIPQLINILRRIDDCFASGVTIVGDQIIDDRMQTPHNHLVEVIDVSVATTQAMVVAISMAEYRKIPLILRVGAPTFGLGEGDILNYMVNTDAKMRTFGRLAVGDMGRLMDEGDSAQAKPFMNLVRDQEELRELRLFLGGGLPVMRILQSEHTRRGKPLQWDISVRRASRVDNGPKEWAALISGSHLIVRATRRDAVFLKPGTKIMLDHEMPGFVEPSGLWVSLGREEGGYREAMYMDRGSKKTVWLIQPTE